MNDDTSSNTDGIDGPAGDDVEAEHDSTNRTEQQGTATLERFTGGAATRRRFLGAVASVAAGTAAGGLTSGQLTDTLAGQPGPSPLLDRHSGSMVHSNLGAGTTDRLDGSGQVADAGTLAPPETLEEIWRQDFQNERVSAPFFSRSNSNRLYTIGRGDVQQTIYALNKDDGSIAWETTVDGATSIGVEEGRALYYTNVSTSEIVAVDESDGTELWRSSFNSGSGVRSGVVGPTYVDADSTVYVFGQNSLEAFDKQDGTREWEFTLNGVLFPFLNSLYDDGGTSLLHVISFSQFTGEGTIRAIDRDTGDEVWAKTRNRPPTWVTIVDDTVVGSFSSQNGSALVGFDAANGTEQWSDERQDDLVWGLTFPRNGSDLYAFASPSRDTTGGQIVKFEKDGTRVWEYGTSAQIIGLQVENDNVYLSTVEGKIASLVDASPNQGGGTEEWTRDLAVDIRDAGILKSGDVLYTGTQSEPGTVYALSATDGSTLDTFEFSSGVSGTIAVFNERLWVANPPSDSNTGGNSAMYELGEGGDPGGGNWYDSYTDDNGVVDTPGFRTGIDDWQTEDISTTQLSTLLDSWQTDQPVNP